MNAQTKEVLKYVIMQSGARISPPALVPGSFGGGLTLAGVIGARGRTFPRA